MAFWLFGVKVMATIIFGVIGAGIGVAVAGPGGAMLGWSIGTTVGSYIDMANTTYYSPDMGRTNDLRVTVASFGTSISQCWGLTRVPGILIWGTDLVEHENDDTSGGGGLSGGPTVVQRQFTYTVSFAMALCKGNRVTTNSVKKIFADDLVVYDSSQSPSLNTVTPRFYVGSETQTADPLIISSASNTDIPAGADNPAFRGLCYMVIQDMLLTDYGNSIPNFSVELDTGTVYMSDVLTDILSQVNIDPTTQLDVSLVTGIAVTGLIIASRIDTKSAMQPILDAYSVDIVDLDGKIKAIPRGGSPVATLTFDDLGAQTLGSGNAPSTQRVIKTRLEDFTLPKRIDVGYFSPTIDMQQATQGAVRQSARIDNYVSVSYPLTLQDTEARQLAERLLYLKWVERMTYQAQVMPRWSKLSVCDVVMLQTDTTGTLQRVRIASVENAPRGEIKMQFVEDDDGIITQTSVGTAPTGGVVTTTPVPTSFFAWSGKELRDTDGVTAGFYVAATGGTGWQGCTVFMSTDGGSTYTPVETVGARSVFGTVSNALGDTFTPDGKGFDFSTNTLSVIVNGTLASTDEDAVLNGQGNYGLLTQADQSVSNSSNYEILGFAGVTFVSTNHYTLADMLRSQRGTVGTGHTNTDVFVNLSSALQRIAVASSLVGHTVLVKCVSPYIDPTTVTAQTIMIVAPTAPYATTGGVNAAVAAAKTPYWRVRGYIITPGTVPNTLDETWFKDGAGSAGANFPAGANQNYWPESSNSPIDIAWKFDSPGTAYCTWLRISLTNPTGASITANWWVPAYDDALKIRVNGSYVFNNAAFNTNGTFSVAAGATVLVEIFYGNQGAGSTVYDDKNQGTAAWYTDALTQGLTWSDAGK
jgi:hypothetical protein